MKVFFALIRFADLTDKPAKAVLTLDPPWAVILTGDKITLKCAADDFWYFKWYRAGENEITAKEYTINTAAVSHSGEYTCKGYHYLSESILSDPIHITVSDEQVILQTPTQPVFEGDSLTLRCRVRYISHITRADYYKDNKELQSQAGTELSVAHVSKSDEGSYKCTAWRWSYYLGDSAEVRVSVRERPQAVLTLEPAWTQIFKSETVTLRCEVQGDYTGWRFTWYKAGRNAPVTQDSYSSIDGDRYTISSAAQYHSGKYTCKGERTGNPSYSKTSDALTLRVSDEHVILQTPPQPVFEGDTLTLRCHVWGYTATRVTFYKDNKELRSRAVTERSVDRVSKSDEGSYKCKAWWSSHYYHYSGDSGDSAEVRVSVRERFSTPTLTVLPGASVWEGETVTLQCGAHINKQGTQLQYRYIKDRSYLRGAGSQDQHSIPAAELRDTGSYQCEVEAAGTGLKKRSDSVSLTVRELFKKPILTSTPVSPVWEGEAVTLQCGVQIYKQGTQLQYRYIKDNGDVNV
ncbi:UNVERIFIED_CONTAM: hypothetical protein FKN15_006970 [Acipenser sinensis]